MIDAQRVGASQRKASCDGVRPVSKLFDFCEYARARRGPDVGLLIQNFGYRRNGNAQFRGDPLHRGRMHLLDPWVLGSLGPQVLRSVVLIELPTFGPTDR